MQEDITAIGQREPAGLQVDWRSIRAEQMMVRVRDELAVGASKRLEHVDRVLAFELDRVDASNVAKTRR